MAANKLTQKQKETLYVKTPPETMVDVFRFQNGIIKKKTMTFQQYLDMEKQPGCKYQAYQVGYCSIKET